MPPRKTKIVKETKVIEETPVVFFLRINEDENLIEPAQQTLTYSEILNSVESTSNREIFNTDLMKSVLDKVIVAL